MLLISPTQSIGHLIRPHTLSTVFPLSFFFYRSMTKDLCTCPHLPIEHFYIGIQNNSMTVLGPYTYSVTIQSLVRTKTVQRLVWGSRIRTVSWISYFGGKWFILLLAIFIFFNPNQNIAILCVCDTLTLNLLNSVYRRFMRYNLRLAPIVYRLIEAALVGFFFRLSFSILKSKYWPNVLPQREHYN